MNAHSDFLRRRAPRLTVDLSAVADNTRVFAQRATRLMAVVKADAFGHGDVAATVLQAGATSLGVATIGEALPLRAAHPDVPILTWLTSVDDAFYEAVASRIDLAVPSARHLQAIARAATDLGIRARVHLHLDAGIARDGAPASAWETLCEIARLYEVQGAVQVVGVMAHLSCAAAPDSVENAVEILRFSNAVRTARRRGLRPGVRHLAATAATLTQPDALFDLSRVGAGLFGIDPSGSTALRSALTLTAPVVAVREVRAGSGVGYDYGVTLDRSTRLAQVPVGYADGLPRSVADEAFVQIRGRRCRILGALSMDQLVVDVGDAGVEPGDTVTLFGQGGDGSPTTREWADWAGTIEHDIVTRVGGRSMRTARTVVEMSAAPEAEAEPGSVPAAFELVVSA